MGKNNLWALSSAQMPNSKSLNEIGILVGSAPPQLFITRRFYYILGDTIKSSSPETLVGLWGPKDKESMEESPELLQFSQAEI